MVTPSNLPGRSAASRAAAKSEQQHAGGNAGKQSVHVFLPEPPPAAVAVATAQHMRFIHIQTIFLRYRQVASFPCRLRSAYMKRAIHWEGDLATDEDDRPLPRAGARQGARHPRAAGRHRRRADPGRDRQAARPQPQRILPHARPPGAARLRHAHRRRPLLADAEAVRPGAAACAGAAPGLLRDAADARACRDLAPGQPAGRVRPRLGGRHRPAGSAGILGNLDPRRLAYQPVRHRLRARAAGLPLARGAADDDPRGTARAGEGAAVTRSSSRGSTRSATAATR